jgi:hypothetical protein
MRVIDESLIPTGDAIYFKQGTWTHLQKAYKEALDAIVQSLIGNGYDNSKYYILHGCVATGTDPGARTISAGAIFYDGEIYLVPAASFTTTGAQVAVGNITVTYNTTDYSVDPQTTPGGTPVSVHAIRTIVFTAGASGSGDVNYSALVDYLQEDCYKDISSSVTVNAAISVLNKEIRKYADGTITVSIVGTFSGNISAATVLVTGLPLGVAHAYSDVIILQYGTTIPYIRNKALFYSFLGAAVVNEATINLGSDNTVSINFEYRVK